MHGWLCAKVGISNIAEKDRKVEKSSVNRVCFDDFVNK